MAPKTEKTAGIIDLLYTNSVGFLRDVFQYAIPGLLFLSLLSATMLFEHGYRHLVWFHIFALKDIIGWIALIIVLFSYICGQIIFSLSDSLFKLYKILYKCFGINYSDELKRVSTELKNIAKDKELCKNCNSYIWCQDDDEIHLFYEISTFAAAPEIHGKFIERYNILKQFRKSISVVFFLNAIFFAIRLFFIPAVVLLVLSVFVHRLYLHTELAFYHRVFWSYFITKGKVD